VSLRLPLPAALKPVALPEVVAVKVGDVIVAGNVSVTVAPVTLLGPALVTVIVYAKTYWSFEGSDWSST